ncbi:MAG: hypothetical protein ACRCY9_09805, partial [Phycicoccus sp.]
MSGSSRLAVMVLTGAVVASLSSGCLVTQQGGQAAADPAPPSSASPPSVEPLSSVEPPPSVATPPVGVSPSPTAIAVPPSAAPLAGPSA